MLEILGAAAAFGLSGGLSPGPLLALVVAETIGRGRSAGLAVVFLVVFYLGLVGSKAALAMITARSREALTGRAFLWINRFLAAVLLVYAAIFIRGGIQLLSGS